MGLRPFAGVGDLLPAAAAQLPHPAADPFESPAFDLHHPEISALEQLEHHSEDDKALAGGKEAGK